MNIDFAIFLVSAANTVHVKIAKFARVEAIQFFVRASVTESVCIFVRTLIRSLVLQAHLAAATVRTMRVLPISSSVVGVHNRGFDWLVPLSLPMSDKL